MSSRRSSTSSGKGKGKRKAPQEACARQNFIRDERQNDRKMALLNLWKLAAPMVDRTKPEAPPKSTESERDRLEVYFDFYKLLDSREMMRFFELSRKYSENNKSFRAPWIESLGEQERMDWTLEFARIAIDIGMEKAEIENLVYGEQLPLLDGQWEKAKRLQDQEYKARLDDIKTTREFDEQHRFDGGGSF